MDIKFQFTHPVYGVFGDALHFADDQIPTEQEIAALKQQRFDNWVAYLEAASQPLTDTP